MCMFEAADKLGKVTGVYINVVHTLHAYDCQNKTMLCRSVVQEKQAAYSWGCHCVNCYIHSVHFRQLIL